MARTAQHSRHEGCPLSRWAALGVRRLVHRKQCVGARGFLVFRTIRFWTYGRDFFPHRIIEGLLVVLLGSIHRQVNSEWLDALEIPQLYPELLLFVST